VNPPESILLRLLLSLPGLAYSAAVRMRNRFWDRPHAAHRAELPVISVGNLTVGGTGKTPVVAWLCTHLLERGRRPAVVTRGYGGEAGRGPVDVSAGDGPLAGPEIAGDEPFMLARSIPGLVVVAGSDRVSGATRARELGADVVVLDDGFQHRRLARDLDIVLVDSAGPFGNGRLLPSGILREPISSLGRAGIVVITRCRAESDTAGIEEVIRRHSRSVPVVRAGIGGGGFVDIEGRSVSVPRRAVAFCGIGNPGSFRELLERSGVEVAEFRPFRDHHPYRVEEIEALRSAAGRLGASLVTTEKDLARLERIRDRLHPLELAAPRIEIEMLEPGPLLRAVDAVLPRRRP
jgi:tetraacyldisaccharide 4'-kinase